MLAEYLSGFNLLDIDKDAFISRAEFGTECAAPFALLDKDGDGKLTKAEYEAGFKLFDIDGDGFDDIIVGAHFVNGYNTSSKTEIHCAVHIIF